MHSTDYPNIQNSIYTEKTLIQLEHAKSNCLSSRLGEIFGTKVRVASECDRAK